VCDERKKRGPLMVAGRAQSLLLGCRRRCPSVSVLYLIQRKEMTGSVVVWAREAEWAVERKVGRFDDSGCWGKKWARRKRRKLLGGCCCLGQERE
jgi:hypothetical protein